MEHTAKIYKNVVIGKNAQIGDFAIIGLPPRGKADGELKTAIGDNAIIRSHTVIYAGNTIGNNFETGNHANIRESNIIGNNVSIGTHCVVEHHVKIEDSVRLHTTVFVPEFSILKKNCWLGPYVVLTNSAYPRSATAKQKLAGVTVEENAKIGANATILPGIKIGRDCLVGAGAVVTKDVPEGVVVVGNPARVIRRVDQISDPESGERVYHK